jgi:uncharacterized membrane protein YgcG
MRRSSQVQLTLLAAIALSMTGCRDEQRDCVDAQGRKVPDTNCEYGYGGTHYIYSGSSGGHYGDSVIGGSSVSRGGFGGIGGSHGGGGE